MIDLAKIKLHAKMWLDETSTEYDEIITDCLDYAKAYVNELIGWRYVPETHEFTQLALLIDNKIYLEKLPVTNVLSVQSESEEIYDYTLNKYDGTICFKCSCDCPCDCDKTYTVNYEVGGIASDYPVAIDNIILDIALKKLNHHINNANGFSSMSIGSDINLTFMYELTDEQKRTIKAYKRTVL